MIDDDAEYEARRQIRAQADADVAEFIASLDQDEGTGVPPPPSIKITEVSSQPVELDFLGFGTQGSGATTSPGGTGWQPPPPPPGDVPWACCLPDDSCELLTAADCTTASGTFHPGLTCSPNPCVGACCAVDGSCSITAEGDCVGDYQGDGTDCDPNPCPEPPPPETWDCFTNGCFDPGGGAGEYSTLVACQAACEGACCDPPNCLGPMYEDTCTGLGFTFNGRGTICFPVNPCAGACCFDGVCDDGYRDGFCVELGGIFQGYGTECATIEECGGACCIETADSETCQIHDQTTCEAITGGTFVDGNCTDPCPCPCQCCFLTFPGATNKYKRVDTSRTDFLETQDTECTGSCVDQVCRYGFTADGSGAFATFDTSCVYDSGDGDIHSDVTLWLCDGFCLCDVDNSFSDDSTYPVFQDGWPTPTGFTCTGSGDTYTCVSDDGTITYTYEFSDVCYTNP